MKRLGTSLLVVSGVVVLAVGAIIAYVVWDYDREHAGPESGDAVAGKSSYVEVDWTVKQAGRDANGRRLHLRIPREYKMEVLREPQTPEEHAYLDNNGIKNISIYAWLPDLSPNPSADMPKNADTEEDRQKIKGFLSKRMRVQLNAAGGGTSDSVGSLTRHGFQSGRTYRRSDLHGLEWYVPMACGGRLPDPKTPKPADDLSPEGCREIYGDHEFLAPGRPVRIRCQSLSHGVCVYYGSPAWWSVQIEIPSWELARWQDYERAALALVDKFSLPDIRSGFTQMADTVK
jgi:hypothetical protein